MAPNKNLNTMTTDKDILPQFRDKLESRKRHIHLSARRSCEMTKAVRDNDPRKMNLKQIYWLFLLQIIPERSEFHRRADIFAIVCEPNETTEDVWTRILQMVKNCEFDNVISAELIFSALMTIGTITDMKHVPETPEKRKWSAKFVYDRSKRRPEYQRVIYKDNTCRQCGAPRWTIQFIARDNTECRISKKEKAFWKEPGPAQLGVISKAQK